MAFSPDASPAFQAYLKGRAKFADGDQFEYDLFFIKYCCQQADLAAAVTAATAVTSAQTSTTSKKHQF